MQVVLSDDPICASEDFRSKRIVEARNKTRTQSFEFDMADGANILFKVCH